MNINDVTVVMPVSWIPSHPDTRIIDETISCVRMHFPHNEIILQIDGLRQERLEKKVFYDEFKSRVLWKSLHEWKNVLPIIFDEHSHQTTMMKATIDLIRTPALLYVESDTPLVTDREIDWKSCFNMLDSGLGNTIRFHHEEHIPMEHNYLMLGAEGGFMKTIQWSQRPHLSLVSYYRNEVLPYMPENTFIEDVFHSNVQVDGWEKHRLWIYHPEGGIKRSYHLDGRAGTRKFTSDDLAWGYIE